MQETGPNPDLGWVFGFFGFGRTPVDFRPSCHSDPKSGLKFCEEKPVSKEEAGKREPADLEKRSAQRLIARDP